MAVGRLPAPRVVLAGGASSAGAAPSPSGVRPRRPACPRPRGRVVGVGRGAAVAGGRVLAAAGASSARRAVLSSATALPRLRRVPRRRRACVSPTGVPSRRRPAARRRPARHRHRRPRHCFARRGVVRRRVASPTGVCRGDLVGLRQSRPTCVGVGARRGGGASSPGEPSTGVSPRRPRRLAARSRPARHRSRRPERSRLRRCVARRGIALADRRLAAAVEPSAASGASRRRPRVRRDLVGWRGSPSPTGVTSLGGSAATARARWARTMTRGGATGTRRRAGAGSRRGISCVGWSTDRRPAAARPQARAPDRGGRGRLARLRARGARPRSAEAAVRAVVRGAAEELAAVRALAADAGLADEDLAADVVEPHLELVQFGVDARRGARAWSRAGGGAPRARCRGPCGAARRRSRRGRAAATRARRAGTRRGGAASRGERSCRARRRARRDRAPPEGRRPARPAARRLGGW